MNGPGLASAPSPAEPRWWELAPREAPPPVLGVEGWSFQLPGLGGALQWLRKLALPHGARLGLSTLATPGTLAVLQAAPLVGICVVLINRRLAPAEIARQIADAALTLLATDVDHPCRAWASMVVPERFEETPWSRDGLRPLADEDAALVIFTSGTSGRAKPARLPLRALRHAAAGAVARLGLGGRHTYLACLPLDHIGGASFAYRAAHCGHRLLLLERFHPGLVTRLLPGCDGISVVPTMLSRLLDVRGTEPWPPRLRIILAGGGPLADTLSARSAAAGVEPCQTYGLTECASQVCTLDPQEAAGHRGWAGRPLAGMEVQVHAAGGISCGPGEIGAIVVRGDMLFSGYEDRGMLVATTTREAWFATGDLGELDAGGYLRVHCRREDLILSGGENIYPREVEAVLESHPAVAEAAVCALEDAQWGQVVAAVVVLRSAPGAGAAGGVRELSQYLRGRLAGYKCPRAWHLASALPRSPLGKLLRSELPGYFRNAGSLATS